MGLAVATARPVIWLLAGLDPTGGAGLLRDLWTLRARLPAAQVCAVVSAWTWQGEALPARAEARPLLRIMGELRGFPRPDVVKVGLLPSTLIQQGLLESLVELTGGVPWVVDPVMFASDGGDLGARPADLRELARHAALVTPNRGEAALLAACCAEEPDLAASLGRRMPGPAWLVKGGHATGNEVVDRLWIRGRIHEFRRPRLSGPDPRGTGCALASAITAGLAQRIAADPRQGFQAGGLIDAVDGAIRWLDGVRQR
ncbi:MAG TPA: hypothetical protein ENK31_01075, partial [Nannocystis exedens]|nr:hypothetical protein [Nannocystis exedens]